MNSTAILARTNRALREPESALVAANIPYHLIGKSGYWAAAEVRAALSYLGAVLYPANHFLSGMLRTDFHPTKFLPRVKLAARFKEIKATDEKVSYWELLTREPGTLVDPKNLDAVSNFVQFVGSLSRYRGLTPDKALRELLGALKVGDYYSEIETIDNDPLANLSDLVKLAARYGTIKEFLDYAREGTAAS